MEQHFSPILTQRFSTDYIVLDASDALLKDTLATREQVIGRSVFDAFPENPEAVEGAALLKASLDRVKATLRSDLMPVVRYDMRGADGRYEARYWRAKHWPVMEGDRLVAIDQIVEDITMRVLKEHAERDTKARRAYLFQNGFVLLFAFLFFAITVGFFIDPDGLDRALGDARPYEYAWSVAYLIGTSMVLYGLPTRRVGIEASGHAVIGAGLLVHIILAVTTLGTHLTTVILMVFGVAAGMRAYGLIAGWRDSV